MSPRPKPLQRDWSAFERKAARAGGLLLGLDFDGTLAPIAPRPRLTRMDPRARRALKKLARNPRLRVAVISGRALADLRRLADIPGVVYVGNHGVEISGPGLRMVQPQAAAAVAKLRVARDALARKLREWPGASFQDKRFSLSLHYRCADPRHVPDMEKEARRALGRHAREFHFIHGRKVLEIVPRKSWHKGDAFRWLIRRWERGLPIFLGDDQVDEHAFRAARRAGGFGVLVRSAERRRPTAATHYLAGQREVAVFLEKVLRLMERGEERRP